MGSPDSNDVYKELGALTKDRSRWEESVPYVSSFLSESPVKIQAKALWLLGEIGLAHPMSVLNAVPDIAAFLGSAEPLLRERAANAVGRIGRGRYLSIEPYMDGLFRLACDGEPRVRQSFIWACENIAVNAPDVFSGRMELFERLLYDADDRVRMEAPEIFRVLAKQRSEFVCPYTDQLRKISETDSNRVARIHCLGALRAAMPGNAERNG